MNKAELVKALTLSRNVVAEGADGPKLNAADGMM